MKWTFAQRLMFLWKRTNILNTPCHLHKHESLSISNKEYPSKASNGNTTIIYIWSLLLLLTVAARVLSKGHHVLQNVELTVRKPASKDQCRLLLRGLNPNICPDMLELYLENLLGLDVEDYTLYPSPGKDVVLIQLNQPFSKGLVDDIFFNDCI